MATKALRKQLEEVEAELASLEDRRTALEQAAEDLRSAIASVEALEGTASSGKSSTRRSRATAAPRPTVTPDDLVGALQDLGGTATVEQLVEKLSLPDGRSLNGARRLAVDDGRVDYQDRTYTLASGAG